MKYEIDMFVMYGHDNFPRHGIIKAYTEKNGTYVIQRILPIGVIPNDYVPENLIISIKPNINEMSQI